MEFSIIANGNWKAFLTLKGEKLLLVIRKHPFVVIFPIITLIILTALFLVSAYILFQRVFNSFPLFVTSSLLLISVTIGIIAKLVVDWYFHVYILTNRKILEFRYTPLTSYVVNDIMLDRVFCTEVDYQTSGIIQDIFDIGDIIITFDRPTHQEEFILHDIQSCSRIGTFLTQQLMDGNTYEPIHPIWFPGHSWGKR